MIINSFAVLMDSLLEQKCLFLNFLSLPESHIRNVLLTSLHSSRVRTARLLTPYSVVSRGVCPGRVCLREGGVPRGEGVCLGVSTQELSAQGVFARMQWSRHPLVDSILDTHL